MNLSLRCPILTNWNLQQKKKSIGICILLIYILLLIQYELLASFVTNSLLHDSVESNHVVGQTLASTVKGDDKILGSTPPHHKIDYNKEMLELEKGIVKLEQKLKKEHSLLELAADTNDKLQRLNKYRTWKTNFLRQKRVY